MTEDLHHCENDCAAPPTFPVRPNNAPALDRIRYRIGDYHSIREALLYGINRAGPLQHWTHRLPDDPGIALLEGTAIVGDILTFYQEHYANEVWLRTARWRESITELVRLLGYRLSPALAGRGTFALEIKGKTAITVPAHFPLKADLAEMPAPVDFETSMEIIAHPHLSKFHLYPPRVYAPKIAAHTTRFEIASVGTDTSPEAFAAVNLKKGDLIMLVPGSGQPLAQTVKIAAITPLLDRVIIDIEGGFVADWSGTVRAWRLGRTFKHQGHQAPETVVQTHTHSDGTIHVFTTPRDFLQEFTNTVWLDTEVKDLAAGTDLIIEITNFGFSALNVARTITSARASTATNVGFTSPALRVQLNEALPLNRISGAGGGATTISSGLKFVGTPYIDVRDFRFHETTSPALTLRPVATFTPTWPTVPKLEFQGNEAQASVLKNRRILLRKPGVEALERTVVNVDPVPGIPRRWALTFNEPLAPRLLARFARSLSILIHKPFLAALSSVTGKLPDIARLVRDFPPKREMTEQGELMRGLTVRLVVNRSPGDAQGLAGASAELQLGEQARFFPSDAALAGWMAQADAGKAQIVYETA